MDSATFKIAARVERLKPGTTVTPKDFLDLANRGLVDVMLTQLSSRGMLRRVSRGLYQRPKFSRLLKEEVAPDLHEVARTLARRFGWQIVPSEDLAANALGLSTQVPAHVTYLSTGPSRAFEIEGQRLCFKHAGPKYLCSQDPKCALVIQAIRGLGRTAATQTEALETLRAQLSRRESMRLVEDARQSSAWIYDISKLLAGDGVK